MPNTHSNDIIKYLNMLAKYTGLYDTSKEYGDYLLSVSNLLENINPYFEMDEDGNYPKLSGEDIEKIQSLYNKIFEAQKNYDEMLQSMGEVDSFEAERKNLMNQFNAMLGKDVASLSGCIGSSKSLPEIFDNARGVSIDISGQSIEANGANLSSRIPVSYVDDSGKEIKGFFTENTKLDKDSELSELYRKAVEGHPEFEKVFERFFSDRYFNSCFSNIGDLDKYLYEPLMESEVQHAFDQFLVQIEPNHPKGTDPKVVEAAHRKYKEFRQYIQRDDTFGRRFAEFAKGFAMIQNKYSVLYRGAEIDENSVVEERNAAMSVVCDMLGAPNLLARSVKMQITNNGKTMEGVFMEFAEGCDINSIKDDSPLNRINEASMQNPEALDSIATLQVEDFICGNVDRHAGNMFYKFEETENGPRCTGVTGIDNDCSFGKLPPSEYASDLRTTGTNHMLVLGEKTVNILCS